MSTTTGRSVEPQVGAQPLGQFAGDRDDGVRGGHQLGDHPADHPPAQQAAQAARAAVRGGRAELVRVVHPAHVAAAAAQQRRRAGRERSGVVVVGVDDVRFEGLDDGGERELDLLHPGVEPAPPTSGQDEARGGAQQRAPAAGTRGVAAGQLLPGAAPRTSCRSGPRRGPGRCAGR